MKEGDNTIRIGKKAVIPLSELKFRFIRTGGPGGQHVNKVATGVELIFDLAASASLTPRQKELIGLRLAGRLGAAGMLRFVERSSRSQWQNRSAATERFREALERALRERKKRVPTSPSLRVDEKRLKAKRIRAGRKHARRVWPDE